MPRELPSFDLVVATVGRAGELGRLLDSLEAQHYASLRVLVVDQNDDLRAAGLLDGRSLELVRLQSARGLSRARNAALEQVTANVVAFPDDDCVYPPGLLQRVAERFAHDDALDGLTGRAADSAGRSAASWKDDAVTLTDDNVWNRAISFTIFLRRSVVERVGAFDERLGLGSEEPWGSGEEIDFLVRAIRSGARIEYDPSFVVQHEVRENDAHIGLRDGASVGYLLRKHGYPARIVGRMLIRPAGGALVALVRLDGAGARYQLATLRGRLRGYFGARRSKISA
ncbi:MAG TPA: glycosyltransferase family A protein [Gaiellaceae bacterium]|nr:glycosyltransferase family A protein [Gaiellaceae bacterium]